MRLEEIINSYISNIRRYETVKKDFSGQDLYNYFRDQAQETDIEPFTNLRFQSIFRSSIQTQEQYDYLHDRAKEISKLAQRLYDKKNSE